MCILEAVRFAYPYLVLLFTAAVGTPGIKLVYIRINVLVLLPLLSTRISTVYEYCACTSIRQHQYIPGTPYVHVITRAITRERVLVYTSTLLCMYTSTTRNSSAAKKR